MTETELKPIIEALIYLAEEPISETTLVTLLGKEHQEFIQEILPRLIQEYQSAEHGIEVKAVANGFKMATKAEHHDWVRKFVKHQSPPTKLSLAALETLSVIAYKQPMTVPEIQEIRGVNAVGVLKTLIDRKLVTTAGRKNVVGRPILYKTTKEFLVHFGLKNLDELPTLEEFEELAQSALGTGTENALGAPSPIPLAETGAPSFPEAVKAHPEPTPAAAAPVAEDTPAESAATSNEDQTGEPASHFAPSR